MAYNTNNSNAMLSFLIYYKWLITLGTDDETYLSELNRMAFRNQNKISW